MEERDYPKDQLAEKENDFVYYWDSFPSPGDTYDSVGDFKEGSFLLIEAGDRDNNNDNDTYFLRFHPCLLLFERWWSFHSQGRG